MSQRSHSNFPVFSTYTFIAENHNDLLWGFIFIPDLKKKNKKVWLIRIKVQNSSCTISSFTQITTCLSSLWNYLFFLLLVSGLYWYFSEIWRVSDCFFFFSPILSSMPCFPLLSSLPSPSLSQKFLCMILQSNTLNKMSTFPFRTSLSF